MITLRRANDRGSTKLNWLDSRHTFSFGDYYDRQHMSSIAGKMPVQNTSVYSATKAAVDAITIALSQELGPRKIRVNSLNPGMVETEGLHGQRGFHQPLLDLVTVQRRQRALFIPAHDVGVGIFAEDVSLFRIAGDLLGIHVLRRSISSFHKGARQLPGKVGIALDCCAADRKHMHDWVDACLFGVVNDFLVVFEERLYSRVGCHHGRGVTAAE